MKHSSAYRRAAELVASGREEFTCSAIYPGGACSLLARRDYEDLFIPDGNENYAWGTQWVDDDDSRIDELRNCRVLALCFAAAIAESEGN